MSEKCGVCELPADELVFLGKQFMCEACLRDGIRVITKEIDPDKSAATHEAARRFGVIRSGWPDVE